MNALLTQDAAGVEALMEPACLKYSANLARAAAASPSSSSHSWMPIPMPSLDAAAPLLDPNTEPLAAGIETTSPLSTVWNADVRRDAEVASGPTDPKIQHGSSDTGAYQARSQPLSSTHVN